MLAQFVKYASAGAVGTAVHYVCLVALVEAASVGAVGASTFGALAGALVNYAMNYRFTFTSARPHATTLARYAAVSIGGIALNGLIVAAATFGGLQYVLAQLLATGVVLPMAFATNRAWTF